jgi:hypothetical protein
MRVVSGAQVVGQVRNHGASTRSHAVDALSPFHQTLSPAGYKFEGRLEGKKMVVFLTILGVPA